MPRIAWRAFDRGLWLAGGRDSPPDGTLRRADGVSQLREGAIRSARGSRLLSTDGANQYVRFQEALFQGRGVDVLRDNAIINAAFPQSGTLGIVGGTRRNSFLKAPPQPELVDYLFVAGGNNPFKSTADGATVTKWGIDAPDDGATGTRLAQGKRQIDAMDAVTGWNKVEGFGVNEALESTILVEGTGSLRWDFEEAATNRYCKAIATDLNGFESGAKSPDQDYIQLWIRLTGTGGADPDTKPAAENLDWIEVAFALGTTAGSGTNTDFKDNVYSRRVDAIDGVLPIAGLTDQEVGTGTALEPGAGIQTVLEQSFVDQTEQDVVNGTGVFNEAADQRRLLNALSQTQIMRQNDVWQKILLPKASFDRIGSDATLTWANVQAVRLTFKRSGRITVLVDDIALVGGVGMVGDYKYQFSFKNSSTGSRSNGNPTPVLVKNVQRQSVHLGNLPQPTDPQVDIIEIWRSIGNGEAFFKAAEVDVGTFTYDDQVIDFAGLYTGAHILAVELPDLLQAEELPTDNAPPPATMHEVLPTLHLGRAWWLDSADGQQGRLFYSPAGRPESNLGFVDVTQTDDPLRTVVRWNDVLWVFSEHSLFRISGVEEPFTSEEVVGALGTVQPDTVVVSPFGLVYQAPDGVRLFDGSFSTLLAFDAIAPIQRGYEAEGSFAFVGVTAAYFREDYWISDDEHQTLVCDLRAQTWRRQNLALTTLYASDNDVELLASTGLVATGLTLVLEDEAADIPTFFQIQTPSRRGSVDTQAIVQRVFIEFESDGQELTPVLVYDDSEVTLPVILASSRLSVEFARLDRSRLIAVRLTGNVLGPVLIYGIEVDVYIPEGSGMGE